MTFDMNPIEDDPHGECRHEIDRLQAENQRLREDVARRILTEMLPHSRMIHSLWEIGFETPADLQFDQLDLVADMMGVPPDNTVETRACEIANETGEWPEGANCRDWLWNLWSDVVEGKATIDDLFAAMREDCADD